jgi:hypothetical protein
MIWIVLITLPVAFLVGEMWLRHRGYRWESPSRLRPSHQFDDRSSSFTGGARIGAWNATWPLALLTVDHEWVRIRIRIPLPVFVPRPVWIPRAAVESIERITVPLGPGVIFRTADHAYDGVIFWFFGRRKLLRRLSYYGWPTDRTKARENG